MISYLLENDIVVLIGMILALFRVWLETIKFDFSKLPLVKKLKNEKFHKTSYYFGIAYIIFFIPNVVYMIAK